MVYIEIENSKIKGIFCASTIPQGDNYKRVDDNFDGVVGQNIAEFDIKWKLLPLGERLQKKLIPNSEKYKAVNEELVLKNKAELVRDGVEKAPIGFKVDTTGIEPMLVPMTRSEMVIAGQMTQSEANALDKIDKIASIKSELASLSIIVPRALEDLYAQTNTAFYDSDGVDGTPAKIVAHKNKLRSELSNLE